MKILYINNSGGGFADYIEVDKNTTIGMLFQQRMGDAVASDYLIRVNRQPVSKEYVLQENDRVTMTPVKIDGARPVVI